MKEPIFKQSHPVFDISICVLIGSLIGNFIAVESGDGVVYQGRVLLLTSAGGVSYILAWPLVLLLKRSPGRFPKWFWLGALGSLIFSVAGQVLAPFISWDYRGRTTPLADEFVALSPYMLWSFIFETLILCTLTLTVLALARLAAFLIIGAKGLVGRTP